MAYAVTTLMNNTSSRDGLSAEHGLSLHIAGNGKTVLFDTGATGGFLENAAKLGIDLGQLDALVFSHGHYDHAGGAKALFARFPAPAQVYAGQNFFARQNTREPDGRLRYIGNTFYEGWFMEHGIPFYTIDRDYELAPGMRLVTNFHQPPQVDFEPYYPYSEQELALLLDTEKGPVVVCGCAHFGAASICATVMERYQIQLYGFIGGTHLKVADEARIQKTIGWFCASGIQMIGACHCSGEQAGARFKAQLPGYYENGVGTVTVL